METTKRNSAMELLRIITIIIIIFHHFNLHGLWRVEGADALSGWPLYVSALTGWGGNVGNEIFLLITGYYLIAGQVHWKRLLLLLFALFFYSWTIAGLCYGVWGWSFTGKELSKQILPLWSGVNWFVCCYLIFMCFVPFINTFARGLTRGQYVRFLALSYGMFMLIPDLGGETFLDGRLIQFFVMYLAGGFIRLHGDTVQNMYSPRRWHRWLAAGVAIVAAAALFPAFFGHWGPYNRVVNLVEPFVALACFMTALCHRPFSSRLINGIAPSVLGIYLIHDNPLLKQWIWNMWYSNVDAFGEWYFPLFMVGKVLLVFVACLAVDQVRMRFLEPKLKRWIG